MMGNRWRKNMVFAILVTLILSTGCTFQNLPPMEVYAIDPGWSQGAPAQTAKTGPVIIQIAPVRGSDAFSTNDILYTDKRHRQQSYAFSRWRDAPIRSMQTVLEVTLEKSGLFKAVLPPTSVSRADLLLESTLFEFGHLFAEDGSSKGAVRMRFYLVDTSKRVVASKELVAMMEVVTSDASGATRAINQAALSVASDLVVWLGAVTK
ncbi:MAG: membrane integrity-associated transporter subunit PqiC [Proteobacteria bacterium]|nr:membrane integrity-associated transporter subunit PqiC [Pseudomonadota bacterium]MBU4328819.1 membrane integrity-associated transporter subunit PqiC [Pseudomonadota bacterium]